MSTQAMQIGVVRIELDRLGDIGERAVMSSRLLVSAEALALERHPERSLTSLVRLTCFALPFERFGRD